MLAHPAGDMRHHLVSGFQLDPKSSIRKCLCDSAFNFEGLFFLSQNSSFLAAKIGPSVRKWDVGQPRPIADPI